MVELRCDDMDKLHPPWPLPPAVSEQRPVSCVRAAAAVAGRAGEGGPGGTRSWAGERMIALLSRTFRTARMT